MILINYASLLTVLGYANKQEVNKLTIHHESQNKVSVSYYEHVTSSFFLFQEFPELCFTNYVNTGEVRRAYRRSKSSLRKL